MNCVLPEPSSPVNPITSEKLTEEAYLNPSSRVSSGEYVIILLMDRCFNFKTIEPLNFAALILIVLMH